MEVSETVFWFVLVPAIVVLVVGGLAYAFGGGRRDRRYRPGRPYDAAPVWFVSAPDGLGDAAKLTPPPATSAALAASPARTPRMTPQGATGGASDRW